MTTPTSPPQWAVEAWHDILDAFDAEDDHQAAATELARLCVSREEFERVREALDDANEELLWNAYARGSERDGRWTHLFMSDGEWLARLCGFDPKLPDYSADEIKAAFPMAVQELARQAMEASNGQ